MDWLAVLGATGPTTLPLLCVPLRMNSVCRLPWVFGTQQGSPVMAALRTSSAVVPQKSSMAEFRCLQPWDTSPQKLQENSLASCLHLPAWSLQMFPMALRQSPKCQLQDGHRFWHTWPSAKFPKTSPLEPQPLLETLDGSSSHLMTQCRVAELANGRLAMMAIIGMFFQARFSGLPCFLQLTGIYRLYMYMKTMIYDVYMITSCFFMAVSIQDGARR